MLIVIEGPDKAGKTTLAKKIASDYGLDYAHFGPPGDDPAREYIDFLLKLKHVTVCDRFFVGELIYGPLLRGESKISFLDLVTISRLCRKMISTFCLVSTPMNVIKKRFNPKKEGVTWDQNVDAWLAFHDLWPSLKVSVSNVINCAEPKFLPIIVKSFSEHLKRHLQFEADLNDFKGIGTIDAKSIVLMGESLNLNTTKYGLPFDNGPSAEFLQTMIMESGIDENYVYVVNQDVATKKEIKHHRRLGSYFVAMGTMAQTKLKREGIRAHRLPHPQYWRRFKSTKWKTYANELGVAWHNYLNNVVPSASSI